MINWAPHWVGLATRGARIVVIWVAAIIVVRLLKAATSRLVKRAPTLTRAAQMREQQTRTVAGILYSAGTASILIAAVLLTLPEFNLKPEALVTAAGLASIAVGFSAQSLLKDLINGFFIVFEDQFAVGDLIQSNGETGRVEHITLRRTVIRNPAGAMVTIPNSLVAQVSNLSRDWMQAFVDVTIPADEPAGRALAVLEKMAGDFRNDPSWSAALVEGPRVLGVESLSLDGTVLRMQVRTALNRKDDVARELRRRIRNAFEHAAIPFSSAQKVELAGAAEPVHPAGS